MYDHDKIMLPFLPRIWCIVFTPMLATLVGKLLVVLSVTDTAPVTAVLSLIVDVNVLPPAADILVLMDTLTIL